MDSVLKIENLNISYGTKKAVDGISLNVPEKSVISIIGPSGCGKSTFLRALNKMHSLYREVVVEGNVFYKNDDIYDKSYDDSLLRKKIGMVFQKPNPFPKSIEENITWALKVNGHKFNKNEVVERCLRKVGLWNDLKDRLKESAVRLSGGQQQRLCIARTIAVKPELILMDEPCSALDPKSTLKIEELIRELKSEYTIIVVTHNMQQALRVSDYTLFMYEGKVVEFDETKKIFSHPQNKKTKDYIDGKFG